MITLKLYGNNYNFEIENIISLFFPAQKVCQSGGDFAEIIITKDNLNLTVNVKYADKEKQVKAVGETEKDCERQLCQMLFEILTEFTAIRPKWGIQTGIRPTKLLRMLTNSSGVDLAEDFFKNKLLVSNEKYDLAYKVMTAQQQLLKLNKSRNFSLYISIPFCVSRCSYCSFVSHDISKSSALIPDYIKLLIKELKFTAKIAKDLKLDLQTVYIGGGTPTAISAQLLESVCEAIAKYFNTDFLLEFTIEAGRPDTITKEKLQVIKESGANRISINPQTLNDDVLKVVRRNHSTKQFYDCFNMAREMGFENINTDLIAGLPTDTVHSFNDSLDKILKLSPESVTVHTLSIKRSSSLVYKNEAEYNAESTTVSLMLGRSHETLQGNGYLPYYMYRQSKMAGNNENIGWAKIGFESYYNVFIMEEAQTILSTGAGASTKLVAPNGSIKRIFNYKYPYEYIRGFDEMLRRKTKIYEFYQEYSNQDNL